MDKLGLVSVSFRDHTPEEIISAAAKAGLSCIEWGSDIHAPAADRKQLQKIAEMQKAAGIFCCSYGTYFRIGKNDPSELQAYIDAARILGTDILRLWCGTKGSAEYTEQERQQLFEQCRACAETAEKNGVTLCMECHNGTMTDSRESAVQLMEAVSSPAFRMYFQPNQFRSIEENLALAEAIAPYTVHLHVFNWEAPDGIHVLRHPLAESRELWKKYLQRIPGRNCMLLEFMPDGKIESLKTEAQSLRKIAENG